MIWNQEQGFEVDIVQPFPEGKFKNIGRDGWVDPGDYRLLWLDLKGTSNPGQPIPALPEIWTQTAALQAMLKFVESGGTLVVSGAALRYPCDLGVEAVIPQGGIPWRSSGETAWISAVDNELLGSVGTVFRIFEGSHDFVWHRFTTPPQQGIVLGIHQSDRHLVELVRWSVGSGKIYGLAVVPWLDSSNRSLAGAAALVLALNQAAGLHPDSHRAEQFRQAQQFLQQQQLERDLKLSVLETSMQPPLKMDRPNSYVVATVDGFVIGNSQQERCIVLKEGFRTTHLTNKKSQTVAPVRSTEFRLTLGEKKQEINLGPADFEIVGQPEVKVTTPEATITVRLKRNQPPALEVKVCYQASSAPELKKVLQITNHSSEPVFLREVWLDTLGFTPKVEVVPYGFLSAFARCEASSWWCCQDLPYSLPFADPEQRVMGVGYPVCMELPVNLTYTSEGAYLTAVPLSGQMHGPWGRTHQFSSYGPWGDPKFPLDRAEIESCIDFVDRHGVPAPQHAFSLYHAYHDYAETGYSNFLPYTQGPGSGWESIRSWLDLTADYGIRTYAHYPECNSWESVPEALKMMQEKIIPHMQKRGLDSQIWFSSYSPGWYGRRWFADRPWNHFREQVDRDEWLQHFMPLVRQYRGVSSWADQGHANIDREYDQSLGYPGTLPMSPHLYKEFKGWDSIVHQIRQEVPDFYWGNAHLGNAQAPLFCGINTFHYWCEPGHAQCGPKGSLDRYPALGNVKANQDAYRREQYWVMMERFVPLRFHLGLINFQISTNHFEPLTYEPIPQFFRYLLLQNLALHPSMAFWGLKSLTDKGIFGPQEMEVSRRWIEFADEHAADLYQRPWLPAGEPRYGKIEIYSYGDRGHGWVFLINPHYVSETIELEVNESLGFGQEPQYAVRELSPQTRWWRGGENAAVKSGERFSVTVPPYEVVLLQFLPSAQAWKGMEEVVTGVELDANGDILGLPGAMVEGEAFSVVNPSFPTHQRRWTGRIPGSSPRLELCEWNGRIGTPEEAWGDGFEGGFYWQAGLTQEVQAQFQLSHFAGAVLWDLAVDPIQGRVSTDPAELLPLDTPTPQQSISPREVPIPAKGEGYWLENEFELLNLPTRGILILQMAAPELARLRVWINGQPQTLEHDINDWLVPNPVGLQTGTNRLVIWLGS